MLIAVTRPEEDAGPLQAKLEAMGHAVVLAPLLAIVPRLDVRIPDLPYQAVAATSANGIRSLEGHDWLKQLPLLTVGPQSLQAAREAGFTQAEAHGGDVKGLAQFIRQRLSPARGPILYLSGAETTGDLKGNLEAAGFEVHRAVLYDAVSATSLGAAEAPLRQGLLDTVMLYSPRTARIWRGLAAAHGLELQAAQIRSLCLSANAATVLPQGWATEVAERPDEAHILALLDESPGTR